MRSVLAKIRELVGLDLRSLALMRIVAGSILVADAFTRLLYVEAHYSDRGILPLATLFELRGNSEAFSVYFLNDSVYFQAFWLILTLSVGILLIIGFKTRVVTILAWILTISIHNRNPIVLQGGDVYFRLLLFWAMFLPWGARLSFDSLIRGGMDRAERYLHSQSYNFIYSPVTLIFIAQLIYVYFFSAMLKTGAAWHEEGSAIYYALSIDQFTTYLGRVILSMKPILPFMTRAVYFLELFGGFLYFVPFKSGYFKLFTVLSFIGLHVGLGASMELGFFPWIMIAGWIGLIPPLFWDKILPELDQILLSRFKRYSRLKKKLSKKISSLSGRIHEKQLSTQRKQVVDPEHIREKIGLFWEILLPLRVLLPNSLLIILFVLVTVWNLRTIDRTYRIAPAYETVIRSLRLDQYWNMFAPYPLKDDGWYVVVGHLSDGEQVDLFAQRDSVSWEKPDYVPNTYKTQRWRKQMMNLWQRNYSEYRKGYAKYVCRKGNKKYDNRLNQVEMVFMLEKTLPDYQKPTHAAVTLLKYECK